MRLIALFSLLFVVGCVQPVNPTPGPPPANLEALADAGASQWRAASADVWERVAVEVESGRITTRQQLLDALREAIRASNKTVFLAADTAFEAAIGEEVRPADAAILREYARGVRP